MTDLNILSARVENFCRARLEDGCKPVSFSIGEDAAYVKLEGENGHQIWRLSLHNPWPMLLMVPGFGAAAAEDYKITGFNDD